MRIAENRCGSGILQQNILSPIEYELVIACGIFSEVDCSIPNANTFGLPLPGSQSGLESLRTTSPTRSRLSTAELTSKRKRSFQEEIQKSEKDETKNMEYITAKPETLYVSLEVIPDTFSNHFLASSYTTSTLSLTSMVSSETNMERSQLKEIHHNEQVEHDTSNLKYVANEIKELNGTLENHTKQLKNINTTLEDMCSLKK